MKRGRILIADADEVNRNLLADFLSSRDLTVDTVSMGSELIQKIQSIPVDVLIVDIELKGMKGYEVIPIIKRIDPRLRIIVTSSNSSLELARKVREEGVFFYALKPLDFEEILTAVRDALKK